MLVDVDKLKDMVKPQIRNTRKYLEFGKKSIDSINIPNDFSQRTSLRSIVQSILDIDNRICSIENSINTVINDLSRTELKNKGLMDGLIGAVPSFTVVGGEAGAIDNASAREWIIDVIDMVERISTKKEDKIESVILWACNNGAKIKEKFTDFVGSKMSELNSNNFIDDIKNSVKGAVDFVFSGDLITNYVDMGKKTASKIEDKIESVVSWGWDTGAEIKDKVSNFISNRIGPELDLVGSKISNSCESIYKNIIKPYKKFGEQLGASIGNVYLGLTKGVMQLVESLLDFSSILSVAQKSVKTSIFDGITYLVCSEYGATDMWISTTDLMWKFEMENVAKDHVESVFKREYANNIIYQWLDENAIDIFKSDGIGTDIASGIGYVAGIIALTVATLRNRFGCNHYCHYLFNSSICNNCSYCRSR